MTMRSVLYYDHQPDGLASLSALETGSVAVTNNADWEWATLVSAEDDVHAGIASNGYEECTDARYLPVANEPIAFEVVD